MSIVAHGHIVLDGLFFSLNSGYIVRFLKYSRNAMARTSFVPWKSVLDMGCSSH